MLRLRPIAVAEAVSYLALLAAVVWFRLLDGPDLVAVLGPVHGVVFLVYVAAVWRAREAQGWSNQLVLVLLGASVLPLGGFWVADRLSGDELRT